MGSTMTFDKECYDGNCTTAVAFVDGTRIAVTPQSCQIVLKE